MIKLKTSDEIEKMRQAGRKLATLLEDLGNFVMPGVSTMDIDCYCEDYIVNKLKAIPGSKGQYGYPYTSNTSVNHVICHGMPSDKQVLKKGDIVNVDVTLIHEGFYADSSKMFCVGNVPPHAKRLVDITQECLYKGIAMVKPGACIGDIGHAIQQYAESNHYSVVREYCGHGIGDTMHEDPQILHYGTPGQGKILEAGMTFTIEPMINQGRKDVRHIRKDNWDIAITKDRKLSAQWEHTMLVTETGVEIFTLREEEQEWFASLAG